MFVGFPPTDDAITRLVTFEEDKSRGDRLNITVLSLIFMNNMARCDTYFSEDDDTKSIVVI